MRKLGFLLSVVLISAVTTSLIANIHLLGRINQLNGEISELQVQIQDFEQIQNSQYVEFEEINCNPQHYDGVNVILVGYLIRSENHVIQYYLTPDFSVITHPPSTKMVVLAGDIETLEAKLHLESYVTFIADFPNEITQVDCQKLILIGRVNVLEFYSCIYIGSHSTSGVGWCIIPDFILPLSTCVLD